MMHLLAVNYYVHYSVAISVNPKGKVKSIAGKRAFLLILLVATAEHYRTNTRKPTANLSFSDTAV